MDWQRTARLLRSEGADRPPLVVRRNRIPPGGAHPGDMHYELELGVVLRGAMERESGDDSRIVRAGQVWLCGMWEPHRFRALERCDVLVLLVRPELLALLRLGDAGDTGERRWLLPFAIPPEARPQTQGAARREVAAWARRMLATVERASDAHRLLEQQVLLLELLLLLQRDWQPPACVRVDARGGERIDRALGLLFERRGGLSAVAAARAVGLPRNRFNRLFVDLMGTSFAEFAARHRLGGAAGDLCRGDEPLKAIARRWRFTDASHLVRRFRARYRCTPARYRARMCAMGDGEAV
ncbi:MAG TPA: AraC family transcriptional regulator [Planctomycetota bacterium]|nr:AraC family transcriptional regulator [Planctomycetota bacterium]